MIGTATLAGTLFADSAIRGAGTLAGLFFADSAIRGAGKKYWLAGALFADSAMKAAGKKHWLARALAITCVAAAIIAASPAQAQQTLVADLNEQKVSIKTDFRGAELLLFGTIDKNSGDDLVIIVEGPPSDLAIRRKTRVGGVWVNTETATLVDMPSFYQLSSTRPLSELASLPTLQRLGIGIQQLPFELAPGSAISEGNSNDWRAALMRNMQNAGLWNEDSDVSIRQNILFRSNIHLPANVLPGE